MRKYNLKATTYIHPRFQYNEEYNEVLLNNGYKSIRGLRSDRLKDKKLKTTTKTKIKFYDRYINLLGHRSYSLNQLNLEEKIGLYDIKESYYLRPYNSSKRIFEKLKLRRIRQEMKYAAKHDKIFHLWWHPHDFGLDIQKNIEVLTKILKHYEKLKLIYSFSSLNIKEIVNLPRSEIEC